MSSTRESDALLAAARDAVLVVDDARVFIDANPAACRLFGLALTELLGRRLDDVLDEPELHLEAARRRFLDGGEQAGERVRGPHGSLRRIEYSATARFLPGRHLAILRDVTERRRAEAERAACCSGSRAGCARPRRCCEPRAELHAGPGRGAAAGGPRDRAGARRHGGAYLADAARENLRAVAGYHVPAHVLENIGTTKAQLTEPPFSRTPALSCQLARRLAAPRQRFVWSTPWRLTRRTWSPSLWARMRQPSTFCLYTQPSPERRADARRVHRETAGYRHPNIGRRAMASRNIGRAAAFTMMTVRWVVALAVKDLWNLIHSTGSMRS
jgi:PAS domain S-box-containing protein